MNKKEHTIQQIQKSKEIKEKGNVQFKDGKFGSAIKTYKTIFLYISGLESNLMSVLQKDQPSGLPSNSNSKNPETKEIQDISIQTHTNIAVCFMKLAEKANNSTNLPNDEKERQKNDYYNKGIDRLNTVLKEIDPANLKARFLKLKILIAVKDVDGAQQEVETIKASISKTESESQKNQNRDLDKKKEEEASSIKKQLPSLQAILDKKKQEVEKEQKKLFKKMFA